ncbi:MAG: precorrin-6y C5,15-methyltransferase (decarboxylating) subunit CbiE [Bacteroidales bacterium]|nr:precorrin-6y C5,15-methyltransferase (decarboxylating) subunit CbiE [Bacteroidales bacterium]
MALSFTIIGLSDNPAPCLDKEIVEIISSAKIFSGGRRHHQIVERFLPSECRWIEITVPLEQVYKSYREADCHIVVFASGDPLFFGFASTLQRVMPEVSIKVYPYFNSLQMLCHRALLPYHDMSIVSLTGRPWKEFDNALIERRAKIGVLTDRVKTPASIALRMKEYGFTYYKMIVGEHLGNPESERITTLTIDEAYEAAVAGNSFEQPNCLILTINDTEAHSRRYGIPDGEFSLLDGREKMITKMPIRLLTLQRLDLYNKHTFWDIGFCTGSISIEARLAFPHLDIKAFEIREEGRQLMESNSKKFSAPGIEYVIGDFLQVELGAEEFCDAAFIGGHGGHLKEIMERVYRHLTIGGCIVFNSVTINNTALGNNTTNYAQAVNVNCNSLNSRDIFINTANSLGMRIEEPIRIELNSNNPIEILKAVK